MSQETLIASHYPSVMSSIAGRLLASHQMLYLMESSPQHDDNWLRLDAVALQVRKVCELFLLGSTLAHLQDGTDLDPKKWRPKEAFAELSKFNPNPLPLPLKSGTDTSSDGTKQLIPASKPMPIKALSAIYGQCGDVLHVPSAYKVLEEKVTPFVWNRYRYWVDGFAQLLASHLLLMPNIHRVLICTWGGEAGDVPSIVLAEGEGEAILSDANLPDFTLVAA
ncbi:MAG: hypothetical protein H2048_08450 [Erythrobacter sp.]|nr:hypothetical protein [Erythrobacter sp.]